MNKLKTKHEQKLQEYTQSINSTIQELQSKKLYPFMLTKIPFIDDYHISYVSNTNRLSEAEEFGDILLAGLQDLVSIVVEDGLGIKEYNTENEENSKLQEFSQEIEQCYPPFIEFEVSAPIHKTMQKLESKEKTDTLYYKKLKELDTEMTKIRTVAKQSFQVQRLVSSLEWKFIKIITAVGLTEIQKIPAYDDIERLEQEAREICEKLAEEAKEYDSSIEKLTLLQAS